ncbi:MAG: SAM-dependent methyltransferase [Bacteroidetes bacterium]|nr:SAM-dependent methyltransferase [Bacteroidota bacterium]
MTKNIKTNERELASKISEWFNEIIGRSNYPFTSTSNETGIRVDATTKFGDIIIWKNRETNQAYSYLELKPPFGTKEDLETFRQKAVELGVQFAFTWDFQNLYAYQIVNNRLELADTETEDILNRIEDWIRGDYQVKIKAYLQKILDELLSLNEVGKFTKFHPDKVYFVNFIRKAVSVLVPKFENFLRAAARKSANKQLIAEYATKQGIAYPSDAEYYKLVSRQTVYALVTKIIFYLTIRRYFDDLPDIYQTDEPDLDKHLKFAFARAREKDWQAVFVEDPIEILGIPDDIYDDIRLLFSELKVYHFGELSEDVIGELFEEIIDPNVRHQLGQYFTNEDLVDLVIGFAVKDESGIYGDPTCGSGTFLIRLYDRLRFLSGYKLQHKDLLDKIWGMDIGKFPAELSTINLFRQNISNYENFPRVIRSDVFDVTKGSEFDFPPPNSGKYFSKIKKVIPEFNGFVGNFPFIRQELIEKTDKGYKIKLTKVIAKEYFLSYPKLFKTKGLKEAIIDELRKASKEKYEQEIERYVDNKNIELKLSGQADIYAYIFIHAATLLANRGVFAIITSNSWLDVSYGSVLKEFFVDNFKIKAVIASWAEPWFEDAAVNTVVTVLEKNPLKSKSHDMKEVAGDEYVKFVKLKKKLSELINYRDLKIQSVQRWQTVDRLVDLVETAHYHRDIKKVADYLDSVETEEMRIRLVKQEHLRKELEENSDQAKWGKFLRAPDVYFEILEKCKDKLVPLKEIADIRRGYTTGINDFFYLKEAIEEKPGNIVCENKRGWRGEIEEKYLKPVIKSPKESHSITIDTTKLKYKIFICNKSKAELKKAGDLGAFKYIEWGEKQKTKDNRKWTDVPSVRGRKYWWAIKEKKPGYILLQMINNDRFIAFLNEGGVHVDHNLFEFLINEKTYFETAKVYLNSFVFALIKEVNSRVNLGDGATKTEGVDWSNLMLAPKFPLGVKLAQNHFYERKVLPLSKEVKQKDRKELDTAVLQALGLDPKEYLPKIYAGLTQLVKERLELPKMRKKQKSQSTKVAYDQIKKAVNEEVLPNGLKKFPEAFCPDSDYDTLMFNTYNSNGKPLKAESFFNNIQLKDNEGIVIFETDSEIKAVFAEMLSRREIYQIKIPTDEMIVEEIISTYKQYNKNLRQSLEASAQQKLHDWHLAEKMADEILEEWGVIK